MAHVVIVPRCASHQRIQLLVECSIFGADTFSIFYLKRVQLLPLSDRLHSLCSAGVEHECSSFSQISP